MDYYKYVHQIHIQHPLPSYSGIHHPLQLQHRLNIFPYRKSQYRCKSNITGTIGYTVLIVLDNCAMDLSGDSTENLIINIPALSQAWVIICDAIKPTYQSNYRWAEAPITRFCISIYTSSMVGNINIPSKETPPCTNTCISGMLCIWGFPSRIHGMIHTCILLNMDGCM